MTKNRLYRTLKNVVRPITNAHSLHSPTSTHAMGYGHAVLNHDNDFALFHSSKNDIPHVCLCKAVVSR